LWLPVQGHPDLAGQDLPLREQPTDFGHTLLIVILTQIKHRSGLRKAQNPPDDG